MYNYILNQLISFQCYGYVTEPYYSSRMNSSDS